jgi:putative multiple sugar transport system permease protein
MSRAFKNPWFRVTGSQGGQRFFASSRVFFGKYSMVVALITALAVFAIATDGVVLRNQNISNLIVQNGYILILAIGMVMVIIGGHIDLSVGSVAGFSGAVVAVLMMVVGLPWFLALPIAILIGGAAGAFHGFWIAYVGIPSFIVTLAGMLIFRGLTLLLIGSDNIGQFPDPFVFIGSGYLGNKTEAGGASITLLVGALLAISVFVWRAVERSRKTKRETVSSSAAVFYGKNLALAGAILTFSWVLESFRGAPIVLVILIPLALIYTFVMRRTVFGRHIYAVGGNRKAARLSGVKDRRVDFFLFVNMGVLAALAGAVLTARLNLATSGAGYLLELEAIAAAFVGGAAVQGGVGSVIGALVGALTIGVIKNGMSIMGLGVQWQQTVLGLVILLFVAFDVWNKRRSGDRRPS